MEGFRCVNNGGGDCYDLLTTRLTHSASTNAGRYVVIRLICDNFCSRQNTSMSRAVATVNCSVCCAGRRSCVHFDLKTNYRIKLIKKKSSQKNVDKSSCRSHETVRAQNSKGYKHRLGSYACVPRVKKKKKKYIQYFSLQIHHRVGACFVPLIISSPLELKLSDAFWA